MTGELMPKGARFRPFAKAVLRTQSDERLVRLVREGSDKAFEEIVRRYRPPLVAFAAAYGPADPEDVVQESLTRSWQSLRQSTGEMNLKPWLYTVVRNRALNAKRDARVHEQLTDQIDGVPQPPDIVLTNEELGRVVAAVGALPEQQREALVRSALDGHTHEQIGAAIGASPGAVRQLIFRGRTAVRHGVGLLIPLPLVRALAESGTAQVGAGGTAAASGGTVLAGGGAGAGVSLAAKAAIVVAVGAVAAGSGVAIDKAGDPGKPTTAAAREIRPQQVKDRSGLNGATPVGVGAEDNSASATSARGADDGPGDDRATDSSSDGSSASSSSGPDEGGSGPSGSSASSGPGSSGGDGGSGDSGEGSSGSGHSGSADTSGSSGSDDPSGSGDHSSGSGHDTTDTSPDSRGPGPSDGGSDSGHDTTVGGDTTVEAVEQPSDGSGSSGSDGSGGSGSGLTGALDG